MMFPREEHRCATIDESGRIEFGLGFAEDKKKKGARRDYNSFDR